MEVLRDWVEDDGVGTRGAKSMRSLLVEALRMSIGAGGDVQTCFALDADLGVVSITSDAFLSSATLDFSIFDAPTRFGFLGSSPESELLSDSSSPSDASSAFDMNFDHALLLTSGPTLCLPVPAVPAILTGLFLSVHHLGMLLKPIFWRVALSGISCLYKQPCCMKLHSPVRSQYVQYSFFS